MKILFRNNLLTLGLAIANPKFFYQHDIIVSKDEKTFKGNSMEKIPLFPLNSVLFPRTPLELYIFEERYKEMINECLDTTHEFGVVLIAEGLEANGPLAKPHEIGCMARISQHERLADGRMAVFAVGTERFKILQTSYEKPYLTGEVLRFPLTLDELWNSDVNTHRLRKQLQRYLGILALAGGGEVDLTRIPDDPVDLAYTAAYILQTSAQNKQNILESHRISEIYRHLNNLYRQETALLKAITSPPNIEMSGGFSKN